MDKMSTIILSKTGQPLNQPVGGAKALWAIDMLRKNGENKSHTSLIQI